MNTGKFNAGNERIKHQYLGFLADAKQLSPATVDQVAAALHDFEAASGLKDFRLFRSEMAQSYKRRLNETDNKKSRQPLSKATIASRLACLKAFFQWLSMQPGFKSRVNYSDADYFNQAGTDARIAKAAREKQVPSIEQIRHVLKSMPNSTDVERRDRAIIAFALVSGARDNAIASLSMRHVDTDRRRITQDPRDGVRTKNSKAIVSAFFPVGSDIEEIVCEWIRFLRIEKFWGPDDPLFPKTKTELGPNGYFESNGLNRGHWKSAAAIRAIFKKAFEKAHLPYFNPHTIRSTLAMLGERTCKTPEQFKAWSQNLGHEHVLTTLTSYGQVGQGRQDEILIQMAEAEGAPITDRPMIGVEPDRLEKLERMISELHGSR